MFVLIREEASEAAPDELPELLPELLLPARTASDPFSLARVFSPAKFSTKGSIHEPIVVQRAKPDGFLILNGHHRWTAALESGIPKIRAIIVNPRRDRRSKACRRS